jgi:hypothetical protein
MPPYLPLKERLPRKPKRESQSQKESKLKEAGLSEIRISAFTEGVVRILIRAAVVAAIGAI